MIDFDSVREHFEMAAQESVGTYDDWPDGLNDLIMKDPASHLPPHPMPLPTRSEAECRDPDDVVRIRVVFENSEGGDKSTLREWGRIVLREGVANSVSIGETILRRFTGVAIFSIFICQESGTKKARKIAGTLGNKFIGLRKDGLRVYTPYLNTVGKSEGWFQVNLNTPFEFDQSTTTP